MDFATVTKGTMASSMHIPPCATVLLPSLMKARSGGAIKAWYSAGRGDYTVHVLVGLDTSGQLYLLDLWRRQASTDVSVDAFLDLVERWKPIGWAAEKGQLANAIEPFLRQRMRQRNVYVATETFPTKGDKSIRAQSIRGRRAVGGMLVPEQASWWPEARAELLSFPAAKFDDIADAIALVAKSWTRCLHPSPLCGRRSR
jgi:predicted phage terminase large subunit-like protein